MDSVVPIPSSILYRDTHPYSSGWWIRQDVFQWLTTFVGRGNQAGGWSGECEWIWVYAFVDGQPTNNAISFQDPKAAMLFKLTWA